MKRPCIKTRSGRSKRFINAAYMTWADLAKHGIIHPIYYAAAIITPNQAGEEWALELIRRIDEQMNVSYKAIRAWRTNWYSVGLIVAVEKGDTRLERLDDDEKKQIDEIVRQFIVDKCPHRRVAMERGWTPSVEARLPQA